MIILDTKFIDADTDRMSLVDIEKKKNRRFYAKGTEFGILAAKQLWQKHNMESNKATSQIGLYMSQYGYLHPNVDDLLNSLDFANLNALDQVFSVLWNTAKINPFLVTISLSNNLLGLVSQELNVRGDCASFLRGNIGLLSAFQEAELMFQLGRLDYALVVISGVGYQDQNRRTFGCCFFLVQQSKKNTLSESISTNLINEFNTGKYGPEDISFIKKILKNYSIENENNE